MQRKFGILVIGFARPKHLAAVLESLRNQDALSYTHVWLDGTANRMEHLSKAVDETLDVAKGFRPNQLFHLNGHFGIEKLTINALQECVKHFDDIFVLEDDCFPCRRAVELFHRGLGEIKNQKDIFSIYGHFFDVPAEMHSPYISRFQGWGWGTNREKLIPLLFELNQFFMMTESDYLAKVNALLTPEIKDRLDITPGRNVLRVLKRMFSWDSCIALLTALNNFKHGRTPIRTIFNNGFDQKLGHFKESSHLLKPPFNMIPFDETWRHF